MKKFTDVYNVCICMELNNLLVLAIANADEIHTDVYNSKMHACTEIITFHIVKYSVVITTLFIRHNDNTWPSLANLFMVECFRPLPSGGLSSQRS